MALEPGSQVGVIGGGPAGSFFSFFLLELAQRVGKEITLDIYEPRDFSLPGPAGCNMCGGIVSESLVQALAAEGINLPPTVVERGLDAYVLHMDVGRVRIETPLHEKRIGAVHRGAGPRGLRETTWRSFDKYLLELARGKGAHVVPERVDGASWVDGRPQPRTRNTPPKAYDLLAVAVGVNTTALKLFEGLGTGYRPPRTARTHISEFCLGRTAVARSLGSAMHIFLLNLPRLEFAALIPKGDYVTLCLLGREIDGPLVESFLEAPEVKRCLPSDGRTAEDRCHCSPLINIAGAVQPFADRMVFIGDCGVTRLYKDGIGAAYRTAKAAAVTAIFEGISAHDFRRHYWPACRALGADNRLGRAVFAITRQAQRRRWARRGLLRTVTREQQNPAGPRPLSLVLWDVFTGSAPYREVLLRALHPAFLCRFLWDIACDLARRIWPRRTVGGIGEEIMDAGALGKVYEDGEAIVRQGEVGDCMYIIQAGQVEVLQESDGREVRLAVLGEGDVFGEMALFEGEVRSATVRALGQVRVLTVDKQMFLRRVHEDPSAAFRILQKLSRRVRDMDAEWARTGR
ncbi:MAG TPA: cyclic nucleotide-binding domain-containing protein [Candidatus Sulfotelmatobacter sp.]|nr:cyclic nucleotide-binding domain-containing protein [Candidatus Sulfotelmatobacter sp.]